MQITREAEIGPRRVDKLVKVWSVDGAEMWMLLHIEVQAQQEGDFGERMFVYHYRIFDRYRRKVVSLAVLADEGESWRPSGYAHGQWGCEVMFRFPVVKLLDYRTDQAFRKKGEGNPFGVVIEAHLSAQETQKDGEVRRLRKLALIKGLYQKGYGRQDILDLFRFIDWVMDLSERDEGLFWEALSAYEEENEMTYVTSVERIGIKKGLEQGLQQGGANVVTRLLVKRFRVKPNEASRLLEGLSVEDVQELGEFILDGGSLDELLAWTNARRMARAS